MDFALDKLVAPIIAASIVLAGQYFIQPLIKRRIGAVEGVLKLKYEAMEYVVAVLEKFYATLDFAVEDEDKARLLYQEGNHAQAKLILYADNPDVLKTFHAAMVSMSPVDRARFYAEVRKEVGLSTDVMGDAMDVPYFLHDIVRPRTNNQNAAESSE